MITLTKQPKAIKEGKQVYKVRYVTDTAIICDTEALFGDFGDEFPLNESEIVLSGRKFTLVY